MEMAASTPTFQEHVNGLKDMYNCSMTIFRRYRVMFWDIFDSVERHDDLESNMYVRSSLFDISLRFLFVFFSNLGFIFVVFLFS